MIEQIKQALEKATPGKWRMSALAGGYLMTDDFPNKELATFIEYTKDGQVYIEFENWRNNAHLIANAPEWLRHLLDKVERLNNQIYAEVKRHVDNEWELKQDRDSHQRVCEKQNDVIKELQKALEFYAKKPCIQSEDIGWNVGFIARQALKKGE